MEIKRYGFEEIISLFPLLRVYGRADRYYTKFVANLGLSDGSVQLHEDAVALLERYVANVHVNCSWYNRQLFSEKVLQWFFFVLSVALLLLVPLIIYFSPSIFAAIGSEYPALGAVGPGDPAELTARLTTLLAGFFAAHRTISAWLNQRMLIGPFWKARSELLNEVYTLETEWGPKKELDKVDGNNLLVGEFKQAIEASLKTARAAVQTERTQFYASYTFPDVNLSESLSNAGTAAGALVTMFESSGVKKKRELAAAREVHVTKHDDLKADVAGLTAILDEWKLELGVKRTEWSHETDPANKKVLAAEVSAMVAEIAKLTTRRKLKIQQQAQERVRAGLA